MNQHTPGPWTWRGDSFSDEPPSCPHSTEWCDHGPHLLGPAGVVISSHGYDASGLDISSANARLIAAAPEMYDLLRGCLDSLEYVNSAHPEATGYGVRASRSTKVRAILAKIESGPRWAAGDLR